VSNGKELLQDIFLLTAKRDPLCPSHPRQSHAFLESRDSGPTLALSRLFLNLSILSLILGKLHLPCTPGFSAYEIS